ncbi:efflux RND transporter periplasmic adaptor subunit [Planctobacterium marinum]|uniref:MexE family multidrug efflux RND transporter periplasmic adaptor subunit n=1 Tax=Planctobacterium marinum TaxID=1631968 RepID=A0AA48I419_9ALTE|nr:MexE family multidrug efflux RND transporter periplasmic adaptor subunit [Planctobacterium marinum]
MKKGLIFSSLAVAMVALISWKNLSASQQAFEVEVSTATEGFLAETVLASGNFIFNEQINIRPQVSGRVQTLYVEEGDMVQQGELLLQLDPEAFEAETEKAQAEVTARQIAIEAAKETLSNLEKQWQRQSRLLTQGLQQQEVVDDLLNQVNLARIQVRAAQANLEQAHATLKFVQDQLAKTSFIAPMSGLVSSLDIKQGETVIAGTTNIVGSDLMTIADPSVILAEIRVDEADIATIALGQQVEIYAAAWPKQPFTGKITQIGTSAKHHGQNPGLSFSVKVLLESSELPVFPGMSCRAEIITAVGEQTTNIPIAAVQHEQNKPYVWVVENNSVVRKNVALGMASDTEQAIATGLAAGEQIVVGPTRTMSQLQSDSKISIREKS